MMKNLLDLDKFEEYFMSELECVGQDRVRNVRISVAKVLMKHLSAKGRQP